MSALWPLSEQTVDVVVAEGASHRVEVGILSAGEPPNMGPRDVGMSGVLVVLGEGQKSPSPTLFKFPSRHRALPAAGFSTRFLRPTGLHPTLQISLGSDSIPDAVADDDECRPYAYLTLPKAIFADRYQLDDPLFLGSKGLAGSRYISEPVDLEAPAYTTPTWGSRVLLELARPSASRGDGGGEWTAEVPLHLRYLEPSATGERDVSVPYPVVFWACEEAGVTDAEAKKLADNPFDRTGLGYDDLFDPGTVFWHVEPQSATAGGVLTNHITVPVLTQEAESWVGPGTAIVVSLGFAWTLWKLVSLYLRAGYGSGDAAVANKDDKKKQ